MEPLDVQAKRIQEINELVRVSISTAGTGDVVWASAGDGGHVAFLSPQWKEQAIDLLERLWRWSQENAPLRITAHFGPADQLPGADGRIQLVGHGINLCGSLLSFGSPAGIVVTEAFKN